MTVPSGCNDPAAPGLADFVLVRRHVEQVVGADAESSEPEVVAEAKVGEVLGAIRLSVAASFRNRILAIMVKGQKGRKISEGVRT